MKIFDNIGCEFSYNIFDNSFLLLSPLPGYSSLVLDDAGVSIPYLARNINGKNIEYELGVGYLSKRDNKLILVDRKVSSSSNNNNPVDFNQTGNKQFYVFVHSVNFNNSFNNILVENTDFNIDARKSVYIVDVSSGYIIANLPDAKKSEAVEIEFKTIGDSGSLNIKNDNFSITLNANSYTKLISTGTEWIELKDNSISSMSMLSDNSFGMLSDPTGINRSLQYNDNGVFGASSIYQGNNQKILFGSDSEASAKHLIPSSGSYDFIINATKDGSNFIVYGTGNSPGYPEKNLYFSYDGKFGINMPSGVNTSGIIKPVTVLHVFNTLCREGIRLENRANCYPADITLYDNPFSYPRPDGSGIARIVFSGKDSSGNKLDYGKIETKIKSSSSKLGQIDLSVYNQTQHKTTISSNPERTIIEANGAGLDINNTNVKLSGVNIAVSGNTIGFAATSAVSITGITSVNNSLRLPYISSTNVLLSIDSNKQVIATTGFQIPGINTSGEYLLSTTNNGTVVAQISKDSFWPYEIGTRIGGKDVTWSRYPYRSGDVCSGKSTREIQIESTPLVEYSIGDQIAIINLSDNSTIYRNIENLNITNDLIVGIVLNQNVLFSGTPNLRIFSVSKGGVLTNTIFTQNTVSDATQIVLSTRPGVDTVFNTNKKDIDFTVYGSEPVPALNIIAKSSLGNTQAGQYFKYATQLKASDGLDAPPTLSRIDNLGEGSPNSSLNNSANFNNAAGSGWPAKVSAVGNNGRKSYYGTFDQNGNVYEWIEDDIKIGSYSSQQYVCGGSWRTFENNALRGYISTPRNSGLDDVGFRVCSKAGYSNPVVESLLTLSFVRVDDINNPADPSPIYTESWTNRFDDSNDQPTPVTKNNLGVVSYPYRINTYEITNTQYAIFLNNVATSGSAISGLYKTTMNSSDIGGITRSGDGSITPYSYHVKTNMENMPATFIDYLSAIRFINWISNGAPTGTGVPNGVTEYGSYIIESGPGGVDQITKNRDQNYWLPTLDEWHKAAYFAPIGEETSLDLSAVTIRRNNPFEFSNAEPYVTGTGSVASLSISGLVYADQVKISNQAIVDTDRQYSTAINHSEPILSATGITYLVNQDTANDIIGKAIFRPDKTILCQPLLVTTGTAANADTAGGILISYSGIDYINNSGQVVEGGLFPGPDGGYLFKDPNGTNVISSSGKLKSVSVTDNAGTDYYPILTHTSPYSIIHNDVNGVLDSSTWFTIGKPLSGIEAETSQIIGVKSTGNSTEKLPILCTDRIFVGPALEGYSGSILTHNGKYAAYWQPNEFLKAPGASWTRYPRRAIEFITSDDADVTFLKFVSLDTSKGGTGDVTQSQVEEEFSVNETIAIYNQSREVIYVKVANIGLIDSRTGNVSDSFFIDDDNLTIAVCPAIPAEFAQNSALSLGEGDADNGRLIGYAFSVQKGAYFDMGLEASATGVFACNIDDIPTSEYKFKPGTFNTISIRPNIHTAFNKMAEDIDFVVYGHRKTLFTRYEPEWFNQDNNGIPTGIQPAFRVHAKLDNSYIGSIESGVLRDTVGNGVASGVLPDIRSKITINTNTPYAVSSLTGVLSAVILPASTSGENLLREKTYGMVIPSTGVLVSGTQNVSNYADLTVSGVTYTDALITKDVVLGPLWTGQLPIPYELSLTQKIYAPNYPLTINQLGQIVSMIPPPAPEIPSKPLNLVATPKNASILLEWTVPEDNGGAAIIGYIVEYSTDSGANWVTYDQVNAQTLLPVYPNNNTIRFLNSNILNNTSYIFRVKAYNSVGVGPVSLSSSSVTPLSSSSPSPVQNVRITSGENVDDIRNSQNITLAWDPPSSLPPDTSIIEYVVEYWVYNTSENKDIRLATWISAENSPVDGNITTINLTGISLDPLYYFSVIAKASNGTLSDRSLYASLGRNSDPRLVPPTIQSATDNPYNFGSVVFTGSCP